MASAHMPGGSSLNLPIQEPDSAPIGPTDHLVPASLSPGGCTCRMQYEKSQEAFAFKMLSVFLSLTEFGDRDKEWRGGTHEGLVLLLTLCS